MRRTSTIEPLWSRASSLDTMTRELIDAEEGCRHRDNSNSSSSGSLSSGENGSDWVEKATYATDSSSESLVNFGVVAPGLYRSGYPCSQHFPYMSNLRLKTIVTLVVNDEPDEALESFISDANIRQVFFAIKGTKKEAIPDAVMSDILGVVLEPSNYPLLVHCNKGKHRTGCVVAAVRKANGWHSSRALAEYRSFAEPKVRDADVDYITNFDHVAMGIAVPTPSILGGPSYQMGSRTPLSDIVSSLSNWKWGERSTLRRSPQTNGWYVAMLSSASICALVIWFLHGR
ncbi:tyrosine phosphatase family-domain-containing protein [Emericellopsis atlantica]|uniref:Tyrosine phosphatase family-domain-containing protein n=1 Tax=Emericellopsis atlantica TaxID=2614577 RepID=A0A9P7ZKP0_9HYPO|nr:tyrosine phosphatase family-domain-containing protein [Emericellopsis atlantica]KAG9253706.1 tyrosine phosphatase family-domain-containing protein [Emericellopsis atlantica]